MKFERVLLRRVVKCASTDSFGIALIRKDIRDLEDPSLWQLLRCRTAIGDLEHGL